MAWPIFDNIDWFNNRVKIERSVAGGVIDVTEVETSSFNILSAIDHIVEGYEISPENGELPGAIANGVSSPWGPSFFDSEGTDRSYLGFFLTAIPNLSARLMNLFDVIGDYLYVDSSFNQRASGFIVPRPEVVKDKTLTQKNRTRLYLVNTVTFDRSIAPVRMTDLYGECKAVIDKCIEEVADMSGDTRSKMLSMAPKVAAELCARRLLLTPEQTRFMLWEEHLGILSVTMDKLNWTLNSTDKLVTVDASLDDVGSVISPSGLIYAATVFAIFKARVDPTKHEIGDGVFVADSESVLSPVLISDITVQVLDGEGDVSVYREGAAGDLLSDNQYTVDPSTGELTIEQTLGSGLDPSTPISPSHGSSAPLNFEELADEENGVFVLPDMTPVYISEELPPCPTSCTSECGVVLRELGAAGQFYKLTGFKGSKDAPAPSPLDTRTTYDEFGLLTKLKLDQDGLPKFESTGFSHMVDRHTSLVKAYLKGIDVSSNAVIEAQAVSLPHLGFSGRCVVLLGYPVSEVSSKSGFQIGPELYLTDVTKDLSGGITKNMGNTAILPLDREERQNYLDGNLAYPPPYAFYTDKGVNYKTSSYVQYAKREYGHAYEAYKILKAMQPIPATEEEGNWWWLLVIGIALLMIVIGAIAYKNSNNKKNVSASEKTTSD
jgi:hypothetical protein